MIFFDMDRRKFNGGNTTAGRKSKAEEAMLIEKLTPLNPLALEALKDGLKNKMPWAVKMYFEYYYGKPRETKDIHITETPIIDMKTWT